MSIPLKLGGEGRADQTAETKYLQRCMNDMVSLLALPAMWSGSEPAQILSTLLDALLAMLGLDFAYARFGVSDGQPAPAIVRVAQGARLSVSDVSAAVKELIGDSSQGTPSPARRSVGAQDVSIVSLRLGLQNDSGVLVAASSRRDFPAQSEALLLRAAANEAAIALHEARLLSAQREIATNLERRVAQRTNELADANKTLQREIVERRRAEEALRENELRARSVIDGIPGLVAIIGSDGEIETINRQILEYTGQSLEDLRDWGTNGTIHPDDMPHVAEIFASSISAGIPYVIEQRLRRHDGTYRWFDHRGIPIRDGSGRVTCFYVLLTDVDDRKRAEQALQASEVRLREIINTLPATAWSTRPDGYCDFLSRRWLDYAGMTASEAEGWGWATVIHPDDASVLAEIWRESLVSGTPVQTEARMRRSDGVYRWFLFLANPLRDEGGNIIKWYGTNVDIEDRKRAETNLADEKHVLEMMASGCSLKEVLSALCKMIEEAAPDCLCDVHPIDWSGPSFEYAVAPSLPASYTTPVAGVPVSPELLPCGAAAHENIQVIAEDLESDVRWRKSYVRDHALKHGVRSVWSTPICTREGHVLGTFCIYQRQPARPSPHHQSLIAHATHLASIAIERNRIETALRRSETLLAEGERLSSTGAFAWRLEMEELAFSEGLRRIFEFDPNAVVTLEQIRDRTHPEDRQHMAEQMTRIRSGGGDLDYEVRLQMPDGRVKHVRTIGQVIRHQDGRPECLASVQDITEYRFAEEALDKARSELAHVARATSLSTLTASIAHEVNQPLAGIVTNANTCVRMLSADPPNVVGALETARRTIRDGNRASDVITRLRALFSKKTPTTEMVDLNEAAREVIALTWSELQRNRVVLQSDLASDLPPVAGDRVQLQQVILNLILNASDAMKMIEDRPRQIVVRTENDENGDVRLTVKDTGVGIDPTSINTLFDAFYTTKIGGMGIGLSVSRSIVEHHQGRIWATRNDGPGATFAFSIPCDAGQIPGFAEAPEAANRRAVENA